MADPTTYRPKPGEIPTDPGVYRFRDAPRPGHLRRQGQDRCARGCRRTSRTSPRCTRAPRRWSPRRRRVEWTVVAHRGRGAPARVLLDQGVRPALQRQVPRRQVLPLPRGDPGRGVPAGPGDARGQAQGHPLLRALRARLGHPRDARPAAAGLPDAHLLRRGVQACRRRSAGPACSATSTSARRRASAGSPPTSTAPSPRTSATSWPATPTRFVEAPRDAG